MESTRFLIAGAGLAGATTARALARAGARHVVLVERESRPGLHASGQNARMIRALVEDPHQGKLAIEGAAALAEYADAREFTFDRAGSLLVGRGPSWEALRALLERDRSRGLRGRELSPTEARARVSLLSRSELEGAIACPDDGTIDSPGVLAYYLRDAAAHGVRTIVHHGVERVDRTGRGTWRVHTVGGEVVEADVLVDAGGAWATGLARAWGGQHIELVPLRRHVMDLGPQPDVDPAWPYVWDADGVYFRTDGNAVHASPCDEDPVAPGVPGLDPAQLGALEAKLARRFPALAGRPVWRMWAGLRTFASDKQFVIGWDGSCAGLFWVAGLGGHGLTTSPAVGALAARLLLAGPGAREAPFDPARFLPA